MKKQPNILFAILDDASHMSAYGHTFVNTPNFDKVAEDGILFINAFTTNPKCAPSRASILTGMHTWQLEEACNHYSIFPSKFAVFPDLLEESGYFVGYTGKGWSPGDWEAGGFKRNPAGPEFQKYTLEKPEGSCVSNKDYSKNFEYFLSEKPKEKPFLFWFGCHEPHRPYSMGEGIREGKKLEDVKEIPAYLPQEETVKRDLLDYAFEIEWFDMHLGNMMKTLEELGELDNTIILVTSDNGMPFPRVKGQMYEQDFHLPMALCWKDVCAGNRKEESLISFIDIAPTFLEAAGIEKHKQIVGNSFMDIINNNKLEELEVERERVYMGRECHDLGREDDKGYPVRCVRTKEYLYVRNFEPNRWPAGNPETGYTNCDSSPTKELILDQHDRGDDFYYNLAFAKRPAEEMYNIIKDPECMENLALNEEYVELKLEMWNDLKALLEKTRDPRIFGKGYLLDNHIYVGKDDHSWKAYKEGRWKKQNF